MRIPHAHRDRGQLDVAMTPMIDVVFLLLIFFLCTASFQIPEELLPTQLATATGNRTAPQQELEPVLERIVVEATHDGGRTRWVVNQRPCDSLAEVDEVLRAVAEIDRALPVILDVAAEVPLGDMIEVYDLARLVGFEQIQFAATPR
jgi:biopolymer transport protein ExbD